VKWTRYTDGSTRTRIQTSFLVPDEMIAFLVEHTDLSETGALRFIRQHAWSLAEGWHNVVVEDGQPYIESVDNIDEDDDDLAVYEGPLVWHA
jgi:glutamine cyclotransferase